MFESNNVVNLKITFFLFPRVFWGFFCLFVCFLVFECYRLSLCQELHWSINLISPQSFLNLSLFLGMCGDFLYFPVLNSLMPSSQRRTREKWKGGEVGKRCQPCRSPSIQGKGAFTIGCVCSAMAACLCVSTSVVRSSGQLSGHTSFMTRSSLPTWLP